MKSLPSISLQLIELGNKQEAKKYNKYNFKKILEEECTGQGRKREAGSRYFSLAFAKKGTIFFSEEVTFPQTQECLRGVRQLCKDLRSIPGWGNSKSTDHKLGCAWNTRRSEQREGGTSGTRWNQRNREKPYHVGPDHVGPCRPWDGVGFYSVWYIKPLERNDVIYASFKSI